jgi:hypothetical protein
MLSMRAKKVSPPSHGILAVGISIKNKSVNVNVKRNFAQQFEDIPFAMQPFPQ